MAGELTREAVLDFLKQRGGRVTNAELLEHFEAALSAEEPLQKAAARRAFKSHVDDVAVVKTERGVKHVCLRKKLRCSSCGRSGAKSPASLAPEADPCRQVSRDDDAAPPGSGPGNDRERVPRSPAAGSVLSEQTERNRAGLDFVRLAEEDRMGNRGSVKGADGTVEERRGKPEPPRITVCQVSPLPEEDLPGPEALGTGPAWRRAGDDESCLSPSESEGGATPTGSRGRFIRAMIRSSPEVRRSVRLSSSNSLASCAEDDRAPATLDPAEHEWMMSAPDCEWASLRRLLAAEPSLVQKRDFVTGFTCLHWAAKQGDAELMARLVHFAEEHGAPGGVDARSSMGYTPLHVAAMHGRLEVVKLLVGAFGADVELRDHSGRKACQYLAAAAGADVRDIAGEDKSFVRTDPDEPPQDEGRPWEKPVRRGSSLSLLKPRMQKLRLGAAQIVRSPSFNWRGGADVPGRAVRRL